MRIFRNELKICRICFISYNRKDKDQKDEMFTEYYIMHGAQVGHTSLIAEAHPSDGVVIRSQARPVEVSRSFDKHLFKKMEPNISIALCLFCSSILLLLVM